MTQEVAPKPKRKPATKKSEKQVTQVVEATPPTIDMGAFSPEMVAQFMTMMSQTMMQAQATPVAEPTEKKITKSYLKTIKDREVRVTSVAGRVIFHAKKSKSEYKWLTKGDDEYLTVEEVVAMDNQSKKFLRTPWLIIDDEEVIEALGLTELYGHLRKIENVDEFFKLSIDEIRHTVNNLPKGYKDNLAQVVNEKVLNKELRDYVVIDEMEALLGKKFDVKAK